MITSKDLEEALKVDYSLSFIVETLIDNLIVFGVIKPYKWKRKDREQRNHIFNALKNSLIDNDASVVFVDPPKPNLLVISKEQLRALVGIEK